MKRKLLTAIALGAFAVSALPTIGLTTALASADRPSYGECTGPAPNPTYCGR